MTTLEATVAPTPIPAPPNFPISWARPDDAAMFWTTDPLHFPEPLHPLDFAFLVRAFRGGFNPAAQAYDLPIRAERRNEQTIAVNRDRLAEAVALRAAGRRNARARGVVARSICAERVHGAGALVEAGLAHENDIAQDRE